MNDMITLLGPTATGKTQLAAHIANRLNGEIISADSRQVYKHMNIGTGKDYDDYLINGVQVPYHLIDIVEAGTKYNVYQYQQDFLLAYKDIVNRGKYPILCGGTGLYIEAILKGYKLLEVPCNAALREELKRKSKEELAKILSSYRNLHGETRSLEEDRLIRAIEIEDFYKEHADEENSFPKIKSTIVGIHYERETIREKITRRLKERLDNGMIEEVRGLMAMGVNAAKLLYYGLEYKFVTQYILHEIDYDEMFQQLNTAIHQFAKRQMTWFRRMERNGLAIHWIDGALPMNQKVDAVIKAMGK